LLIVADARRLPLRDGCVNAVVTSPPYWGLRDYGSSDQIGLEPTPDAYVANLVAVFTEVRRVLVDDGTVWLNLGDSYGTPSGGGYGPASTLAGFTNPNTKGRQMYGQKVHVQGVKSKNLNGIPWRVAFALQADGWYLRSDIIWAKPNPMPESVTDRPTKAHEHLFLLAKTERYHYDADAIAERGAQRERFGNSRTVEKAVNPDRNDSSRRDMRITEFRNKRDVWTVATMPYSGAHFATMPEALVEPCILAGCPVGGLVCDPFVGSGTVGAVAERLGRRWVGTDLSYQPLATARTAQRGLRW
jgi:DNA modification methylase